MKNLLLSFLGLICCIGIAEIPQTRRQEWQKVEEASEMRLPKTALKHLEKILPEAMAEKAYAEATKAMVMKILLEAATADSPLDSGQLAVDGLKAGIHEAPEEMRPVLHTINAIWYWEYFRNNRWKFLSRTQTDVAPGEDFATWDLSRILGEVDHHFSAALHHADALKATPLIDWIEILRMGEFPIRYRPTLYDFLVHEALGFYQAGEQGATISENPFDIRAEDPILAPAMDFLAWNPDTDDQQSPTLKAIRLYQDLLGFHASDTDRSALHDADLARIEFAKNTSTGTHTEAAYQDALQHFISGSKDHEISSLGRARLANHIRPEDPAKAHAIARAGLEAYPDSPGGIGCYNLIQEIETPDLRLSHSQTWNGSSEAIEVHFRNLERLHFRLVELAPFEYLDYRPYDNNLNKAILDRKPAYEWQSELPPHRDYREHQTSITLPEGTKPGFYLLFASKDAGFAQENNLLTASQVTVSDIGTVFFPENTDGEESGLVVSAITGEPVAGAEVQVWFGQPHHRQKPNKTRKPDAVLITDKEGKFLFRRTLERDRRIRILASYGNHGSSFETYAYDYPQAEAAKDRCVFFTDRAIYRPGQNIHYKGILFQENHASSSYRTLSGRNVTVVFYDANNQEIARTEHRSNDYGSLSGTFTAPRDRLTGVMRIETIDRLGSSRFRVEEYKRPRFEVTLEAPDKAPRLNEEVTVLGRATSYTGASVDGAKVIWRVERSTRMPSWRWWPSPLQSTAIAHGETASSIEGNFSISFPATPDSSVAEQDEPVFTYNVHTDVTDSTGETRSTTLALRVGYTSMQAQISTDEWLTTGKPASVAVTTTTLDGAPHAAQGTLKVFSLKAPTQSKQSHDDLDADYDWDEGSETDGLPPTEGFQHWNTDALLTKISFETDKSGKCIVHVPLEAGVYRIELESQDRLGKPVRALHNLIVIDPESPKFTIRLPFFLASPKTSLEPGDTFTAVWGSGHPSARAFVEILSGGTFLQRYWTTAGNTQETIRLPVTEAMRGGFSLRITQMRNNTLHHRVLRVAVPWTHKNLKVQWEQFRSKLGPAETVTWTAKITGPDAKASVAELVATLYDASLEAFANHFWSPGFARFRNEPGLNRPACSISSISAHRMSSIHRLRKPFPRNYTTLDPSFLLDNVYRYLPSPTFDLRYSALPESGGDEVYTLNSFEMAEEADGYLATASVAGTRLKTSLSDVGSAISVVTDDFLADIGATSQDKEQKSLDDVQARKNLQETAFFYPHLLSDEDGRVRIEFTMPEALTRWAFLGLAHDKELRSGLLTGTATTSKDLMIQPNPPRFVREGDRIAFTVKVTNQGSEPASGKVRLTFADAATLTPTDAALGNLNPEQTFEVPTGESRSYAWEIVVPDGMGYLSYKAVGASDKLSDGEEGYLPVLSRNILVTESLPLPIRGKGERNFRFEKLLTSATSDTLRHQSLTVQMVSQPAWYAVMALPYLMEYPHECSEQLFNRLYANALARHIANSDPKIRRIFDLWRESSALESPLFQNEDLKSVMIQESPWLLQAQRESESRKQVGLLFESNRLQEEMARGLHQLSERQLEDGLWPWFPGGSGSEFISRYIITGFARLRALGVEMDIQPALKALPRLDNALARQHETILKGMHPENYEPSSMVALYLYGRSFFLADQPVDKSHREAFEFFLKQANIHWNKSGSLQTQAHLALALKRFGDPETARAIMASLSERSIRNEELGMYWKSHAESWWWYHAPIETQALIIEAFAEITEDFEAVEDCKVWLLKQKQTQNWESTKATADAVYALLSQGTNLLSSDALVEVSIGGETLKPKHVEAGTGYYEHTWVRDEVRPQMGEITLRKSDDGVSWGSAHWQYLEDISKVTPHEDNPLKLTKSLWIKETDGRGQILKPVSGPLAPGDELVVRIELRADRDFEYVHLKDQRGSGTEPVNVLSRYRWQDGLGYYESTRDTASHFFIDYLPRGTYVFEYSTRIQHRGTYQSGIASIQCMYAPEFNSHSASFAIHVD